MTGSVEVAQHIQLLLKAMRAKRCLELGCFTGYTSLSMAQVLPQDGEVITCDINENFAQKEIWKEAGVDQKAWVIYLNKKNKIILTFLS